MSNDSEATALSCDDVEIIIRDWVHVLDDDQGVFRGVHEAAQRIVDLVAMRTSPPSGEINADALREKTARENDAEFARLTGIIFDQLKEIEQLRSQARESELAQRSTAWLIEWPEDDSNPVRWWNPAYGWMRDANKAMHFARKTDTDCFLSTMRFGLNLKVTEHVFIGGATASQAPAESAPPPGDQTRRAWEDSIIAAENGGHLGEVVANYRAVRREILAARAALTEAKP